MRVFGVPAVALVLTLAGLVPLASGAAVLWAAPGEPLVKIQVAQALSVYGALILSFLGGIRWGAEVNGQGAGIPRAPLLWLSVLGTLGVWPMVLWALWTPLSGPALAALAAGHLLQLIWDGSGAALPIWMRRLRVFAGSVAVLSLSASAAVYVLR